MINDKFLTHLVGWTVCLLAGAAVIALIWQSVVQHKKADSELHDLVILLAGGILTAFRTGHTPGQGDDPIPTTVQNTVADPVPTSESTSAPSAEITIHPDAPATSDL